MYWHGPGFDQVAAVYPRVAAELFDTGVNMGPETAAGYLQRSLNALNRGGKEWRQLRPDGDIGPATMEALSGFRSVRGLAGEQVLLTALNALQGEHSIELAERHPKNQKFLYGWLANRVAFA
jgi:lysozyme family protein